MRAIKKVTNTHLQVQFENLDFSNVEEIKFVFEQEKTKLMWTFPSDKAFVEGDSVYLKWTIEDTEVFTELKPVKMDTFIKLKDTEDNPPTNIVEFRMAPTLFTKQEVVT